jgi:hypothetical protein
VLLFFVSVKIQVMKLLFASLLIVLVTGCIFAQAPSGPALSVVKKKWSYEIRNPSLDQDPVQETADRQEAERQRLEIERRNEMLRARGMPTQPVPPPLPPVRLETSRSREATVTYTYLLTVRNNSNKPTNAVTWEYVFLESGTGKEVGRRRFVSRTHIRPGRSANLLVRSAIPPTGTVSAAESNLRTSGKYTEQAVIVAVEYSDGSKWPFK